MDEQTRTALARRQLAAPDTCDWSQVEAWVERAYALTRPGGVVSLLLPDGKPFVARKPLPCDDCGWTHAGDCPKVEVD